MQPLGGHGFPPLLAAYRTHAWPAVASHMSAGQQCSASHGYGEHRRPCRCLGLVRQIWPPIENSSCAKGAEHARDDDPHARLLPAHLGRPLLPASAFKLHVEVLVWPRAWLRGCKRARLALKTCAPTIALGQPLVCPVGWIGWAGFRQTLPGVMRTDRLESRDATKAGDPGLPQANEPASHRHARYLVCVCCRRGRKRWAPSEN